MTDELLNLGEHEHVPVRLQDGENAPAIRSLASFV
jgi:hypothetical protein